MFKQFFLFGGPLNSITVNLRPCTKVYQGYELIGDYGYYAGDPLDGKPPERRFTDLWDSPHV